MAIYVYSFIDKINKITLYFVNYLNNTNTKVN